MDSSNICNHKWVVYSTALPNQLILVQCINCKTKGNVPDATTEEWRKAHHAPNHPWEEPERVLSYEQEQGEKILAFAKQLYQHNAHWVDFFREIFGPNGAARKCFPNTIDYLVFEKSTIYHELQSMVSNLRAKSPKGYDEPTSVITIRIPQSLRDALKLEAADQKTSMNKLCISKLLQRIEQ
jgi:hypothetical protein